MITMPNGIKLSLVPMISFRREGDALIVVVGDQGDEMKFLYYFKAEGNYNAGHQTFSCFEFADGTVWEDIRQTSEFATGSTMAASAPASQAATFSQVNNLISAMATFAPEAGSASALPTNQYNPNSVMIASSVA